MTMRTTRRKNAWPGFLFGVAALLLIAGCGVSEPSGDPWRDVARFSWPQDTTALMRYKKEQFKFGRLQTEEFSDAQPRLSEEVYGGRTMFILQTDESAQSWTRYVATHDTLVTRRDRFPGDIALAAPLVKGQSWICGADTAPWRATVLERYSYRKVDGVVYQNVVEVEYRPDNSTPTISWVRFYAEGIGPVQTIKNVYDNPAQTLPEVEQRTVLVSSSMQN